MMKEDIERFTNYVFTNYDINNKLIKEKYNHSLNVSMLMLDLALRLNLDDHDTYLAFLIGLFHDLGRFREVVRSNKFNNLTFDHGAYSNKILFNDQFINEFNISPQDYLVVKKAIYFHNKKDIPDELAEREELFVKMIRDADKIDIIDVMIKKCRFKINNSPNKNVLKNYFKNDTIDLRDLNSSTDRTILYLSFLKDLYFDESRELALEKHSLNKLINSIRVEIDYEELYYHLVSKIVLKKEDEESKEKSFIKKKYY